MKRTPTACAAILLVAVGASHLDAQTSCSGTASCLTSHTVNVTVGGLISLDLSSASTALTNPTAANIASGAVLPDPGPMLTISANQAWTVHIRSLNSASWNYSGTAAGSKPIGELAWGTAAGGTFTPITNTDVVFAVGAGAASGSQQASFFRTTWVAGFGAPSNAPGNYTLPIAFTLTAP